MTLPASFEDWLAESRYTLKPSDYPLSRLDLIEQEITGADVPPMVMHLSTECARWLRDALNAAHAAGLLGADDDISKETR